MLQVLHMGLHVCQLMGYQQINDGLQLITDNSARTFGLEDYGIVSGNPANLIILPAENGFEGRPLPGAGALVNSPGKGDRDHPAGAKLDPKLTAVARSFLFMRNSPLADAKGPKA